MKLHVWLAKNDRSATWLAEQTGLSVSYVSRLIEKDGATERSPSIDACGKIAEATGGEVTANDFMSTSPRKKKHSTTSSVAA